MYDVETRFHDSLLVINTKLGIIEKYRKIK